MSTVYSTDDSEIPTGAYLFTRTDGGDYFWVDVVNLDNGIPVVLFCDNGPDRDQYWQTFHTLDEECKLLGPFDGDLMGVMELRNKKHTG